MTLLAQLRPLLSLRHVRFAATATDGSMTVMKAQSCHSPMRASMSALGPIVRCEEMQHDKRTN